MLKSVIPYKIENGNEVFHGGMGYIGIVQDAYNEGDNTVMVFQDRTIRVAGDDHGWYIKENFVGQDMQTPFGGYPETRTQKGLSTLTKPEGNVETVVPPQEKGGKHFIGESVNVNKPLGASIDKYEPLKGAPVEDRHAINNYIHDHMTKNFGALNRENFADIHFSLSGEQENTHHVHIIDTKTNRVHIGQVKPIVRSNELGNQEHRFVVSGHNKKWENTSHFKDVVGDTKPLATINGRYQIFINRHIETNKYQKNKFKEGYKPDVKEIKNYNLSVHNIKKSDHSKNITKNLNEFDTKFGEITKGNPEHAVHETPISEQFAINLKQSPQEPFSHKAPADPGKGREVLKSGSLVNKGDMAHNTEKKYMGYLDKLGGYSPQINKKVDESLDVVDHADRIFRKGNEISIHRLDEHNNYVPFDREIRGSAMHEGGIHHLLSEAAKQTDFSKGHKLVVISHGDHTKSGSIDENYINTFGKNKYRGKAGPAIGQRRTAGMGNEGLQNTNMLVNLSVKGMNFASAKEVVHSKIISAHNLSGAAMDHQKFTSHVLNQNRYGKKPSEEYVVSSLEKIHSNFRRDNPEHMKRAKAFHKDISDLNINSVHNLDKIINESHQKHFGVF
jgi:hypothetical protein